MATEKLDKKNGASSKEASEKILETARQRFKLAQEAEHEIRKLALEDLKFSAGEQWPDEIKQARDLDRRPCLTINRLPQTIHQITNDQRQNRPSIKVSPVDDRADIETAKIYQGLIRHIEYSSDADTAYDTAFDSAVRSGFGYFRVLTEYTDPMSFNQDIRIRRVRNRFNVYLDPSYQKPDGSDANWGFIVETLSKDDFKARYPKAEVSAMSDWESLGDQAAEWVQDGTCRVAEYFYKTFKEVSLCLLNTGETIVKDSKEYQLPEGVFIVDERKSVLPAIKWCKINGLEILEETDWPGQWIPIIPVLGDELDIDGKRILEGVIRHAKDPQRMYNYWASSETETIALAPRAPWIGVEGQFEGHESKWATANTKNHAYLEVKPVTLAGAPAPMPQRNVFEPPVQAISQARMLASEDLKATTGIYDAALGARSNEKSGIAIQRRSMQAQTSNYHFIDNLAKSIRHCGRIIVDLIPHVYDTPRAVRILGEDGSEEVVKINEIFEKGGEQVVYDLGAGKYDVAVSSGPSFETKRQEAVEAMLEFTRAMPQHAAIISDLLVQNMDWPGAQEIAERLRKTLPPGMAEDKDKKPIPPEVQAQLQQMDQMIQALTEQLNEKTKIVEMKTVELESRERIELAKIQANIEIELAKMGSQEGIELLRQEVAQIEGRLNLLKVNQPIEFENQGAGADQGAVMPEQQQSTGGIPPGQPMGV